MKLDADRINADIKAMGDVDDSNCLAGRSLRKVNVTLERAKAVLGAFEAFETLAEIQKVQFVALVGANPIEITVTPAELVCMLRMSVKTLEEDSK